MDPKIAQQKIEEYTDMFIADYDTIKSAKIRAVQLFNGERVQEPERPFKRIRLKSIYRSHWYR